MKNITIFISFLLLTACVEESSLQSDNLVVNSFFSDKTPLAVRASHSVSIYDTATYKLIPNLNASLFHESNMVGELKAEDAKPKEGFPSRRDPAYTIEKPNFKQGETYKVEFMYKGMKVSAEDRIPKAVPFTIKNPAFIPSKQGDALDANSFDGYRCNIEFSDPKNEDNYYMIAYNNIQYMSADDNIGWNQSLGWMVAEDPAIEDRFYYASNTLATGEHFIFSDKYFEGNTYTISVDFMVAAQPKANLGLRIYFFSISKSYYDYIRSHLTQVKNNDDYYAEPSQVFNNVQNGFGIFAGFTFEEKTIDFRNL